MSEDEVMFPPRGSTVVGGELETWTEFDEGGLVLTALAVVV